MLNLIRHLAGPASDCPNTLCAYDADGLFLCLVTLPTAVILLQQPNPPIIIDPDQLTKDAVRYSDTFCKGLGCSDMRPSGNHGDYFMDSYNTFCNGSSQNSFHPDGSYSKNATYAVAWTVT